MCSPTRKLPKPSPPFCPTVTPTTCTGGNCDSCCTTDPPNLKLISCILEENLQNEPRFLVSCIPQVHHGCTGPGDASTWRVERQRLEDHQRAPRLWRRHLGLHHTFDVRQPGPLTSLAQRTQRPVDSWERRNFAIPFLQSLS